jgi:hypothetical protein
MFTITAIIHLITPINTGTTTTHTVGEQVFILVITGGIQAIIPVFISD